LNPPKTGENSTQKEKGTMLIAHTTISSLSFLKSTKFHEMVNRVHWIAGGTSWVNGEH
jgi:hypothetical protein